MSDSAPTRHRPARLLLLLGTIVVVGVTTATLGLLGKEDPAWERVHADFAVLSEALERYRQKHGTLPDEGPLDFLVPEYLPAVPVDPWGRPYLYSSNGTRPLLISLGRDGARGGFGAEQDHTLHDGHGR